MDKKKSSLKKVFLCYPQVVFFFFILHNSVFAMENINQFVSVQSARRILSLPKRECPLILSDSTSTGRVLPTLSGQLHQFCTDQREFYSKSNLFFGAGLLLAGGFMAHLQSDQRIQSWYQTDIRNAAIDDIAAVVKHLGSGEKMLPLYLTAAAAGYFFKKNSRLKPVGNWAQLSLRMILTGAPPVVLLQRILGASRPTENDARWRPFNDDNAVSGHAFMGAVPLLAAAKMSESSLAKSIFYLASPLTAWSRMNDNKHYFSQIMLGWSIAFISSRSLDDKSNRMAFILLSPAGNTFITRLRFVF